MTDEKKENKNVSVFARSKMSFESDPLEEIFALNLGDFISAKNSYIQVVNSKFLEYIHKNVIYRVHLSVQL